MDQQPQTSTASKGVDNPKKGRSSAFVTQERVAQVVQWILEGQQRAEILQNGAKWGLQNRQVDDYIKKARENIQEVNSQSAELNLAIITTNLWDLYRCTKATTKFDKEGNALYFHDITEGRQILMAIAKLRGLEQVKIEHTFEDRELKDLSNEELDAILAKEKLLQASQGY